MRSMIRASVVVVTSFVLVPQLAFAVDVEEQLRLMQERIEQLEGQIKARSEEAPSTAAAPSEAAVDPEVTPDEIPSVTHAVISEEPPLIEPTVLEEREAKSSLSSFLESTEFTGWVAGSYNYQFNGSGNDVMKGRNAGVDGAIYTLHPDHNTFSVDQVWFEIDKAVSDDSRGGFHIDFLFGKTAEELGAGQTSVFIAPTTDVTVENQSDGGALVNLEDWLNSGVVIVNSNDSGDLTKLYSAYVSYLAPVGTGIQFDFGKMPTLLGAEVVGSPYNFNITRGIVWNLQPITNVGVLMSAEVLPGFSAAAGFMNGVYTDTNVDIDSGKAVTGQLAYSTDMFSVATSVIWGSALSEGSGDGDKAGVLSFLAVADPIDKLSLWLDFTFAWFTDLDAGHALNQGLDGENYGIALAARWSITDRLGFSTRAEWVRKDWDSALADVDAGIKQSLVNNGVTVGSFNLIRPGDSGVQDWFAMTGTVDFALTSHLQLRGELRYDWTDAGFQLCQPTIAGGVANQGNCVSQDAYYWNADGGLEANQLALLLEVLYTF